MRAVLATSISVMSLAACTSVKAAIPIHELARDEAPLWKMESLEGMDDYLLQIYETGVDDEGRSYNLEVGDVDFVDFAKSAIGLTIHGKTEFETEQNIHINFSSCNALMGHFDIVGNKLSYQNIGQTAKSCERAVTDNSGKLVVLPTPMLVDDYIKTMMPKITGYNLSQDNQKLTLNGENEEVLGVFARHEATQ